MKIKVFLLLFCCSQLSTAQSSAFSYISPKPNSIFVSCETNIILRNTSTIDRASLLSNLIRVEGSQSGLHTGALILSDDERTIVFSSDRPFSGREVVHVILQAGVKTNQGEILPAYSFNFTTMPQTEQSLAKSTSVQLPQSGSTTAVMLPAPPIKIDSVNNPSPGCIFLATWDRNTPSPNYANFIFILDSSGHILDSMRINGPASDFKILSNGLLSYSRASFSGIVPSGAGWTYFVLNENLVEVDSFKMKNGYNSTDGHEFQLLPNGHALLMSYVTVTYDMSKVIPGGKTDAAFTICVLQEQDINKNVVFEWRDIDYIPITDTDVSLTAAAINYTTLNAFTLDDDGNFLVSSRTLSSILKISRSTGEILWRLGGKKGEFTFVGEHAENAPYYFARQHHISRLPNGHITLFDNGDFHPTPYSRAVEYELDEVNKVATMVSEYRYPTANIFSLNGGAAHKLSDGGWFLGFGNLSPQSPVKRIVVEAHADGSTALELSVPNNVTTYRIAKQPWKKQVQKPSITIPEVKAGDTYSFNKNGINTGTTIKYIQLSGDLYNMATITRIPYGPIGPEFIGKAPRVYPVSILYEGASIYSQNSEIHINLSFYPEIKHPAKTSIYGREFAGQGVFINLSTTYDSSANELIAAMTTFGEIVFGEPDFENGANIPIQYIPIDKKKILPQNPVTIRWTGQGLFESFRLQISTDTNFNALVLDTTMISSFYIMNNPLNYQKYYWHVSSIVGIDTSKWSLRWNFESTDAFIKVALPVGGEIWYQSIPMVIRWETNITDSVKLDLLQAQSIVKSIGKTAASIGAFQWVIPTNLLVDSTYRIRIVNIIDSTIADTSDSTFKIFTGTGIKQETEQIPKAFNLYQNYPNPFNPSTSLQFQIPQTSRVTIQVIDILGREVVMLSNGLRNPGSFKVNFDGSHLPSGIYFARMKAQGIDGTNFVQVRKMMLLK